MTDHTTEPTMPSNKWEEAMTSDTNIDTRIQELLDELVGDFDAPIIEPRSIEHARQMRDLGKEVKRLKSNAKAQIKQLIKEARIAETKLWYNEWGYGQEQIGDGSWEDYYESRLAALKERSRIEL